MNLCHRGTETAEKTPKIKLRVLCVSVAFFNVFLFAQDASDILEQDIALPRTTLIQETLEELAKNPLDINQATYEDLIKIPYLTPVLAYQIIEIRIRKGNFKSISEIKRILGNDIELFGKIRPFITTRSEPTKTSSQIRLRFSIDTLTHISQTKQWEFGSRVAFSSFNKDNHLKIVLNTDKDINETRLTDFFSATASITTKHNKLILGNYVLSFGSQLLFSGPYSYVNSIKNFSASPLKSINELTGIYEHSSLFGIGFYQALSNWGFYSFLSTTLLDADIKNEQVKRVFYYTKYTDSTSQARRNQLREDLAGFRITNSLLSTEDRAIIIGLTAYHNQYDKPFAPSDSSDSFYGSNLNLVGLDVQSKFGNYLAKNEFGYSLAYGFGNATQIIGDWQFLKVNLSLYAQQKDFFSPHSKWRTLTNRNDRITGSFNIYYNLYGFKMYLLTSTQQNFTTESLSARVQYKLERKQNKFNFGLTLKGNYQESVLNTYGTRFDLSYQIDKNLELFARIEDRYLKAQPKFGRLVSVGSNLNLARLMIEPRFYYFNISSSNCKIYAYESNAGSYAFNNEGYRVSVLAKTKINQWFKLDWQLGYTSTDKKNFNTALQVVIDL